MKPTRRLHLPLAPRRLEARTSRPRRRCACRGCIGADIQMQLDVCPPGESPRAGRRGGRRAHDALGAPRARGAAPRAPGALRNRAGCMLSRSAPRARRGARGARLAASTASRSAASRSASRSRRCTRRSHEVAHRARSRAPALPHGRRHAARSARGDRRRRRHVRLRAADAQRAQRPGADALRSRRHQAGALARGRQRPIDPSARARAAAGGYSRAYLRHLYLAGEMPVLRLLSVHNLHWYGELVRGRASAIRAGTLVGVQGRHARAARCRRMSRLSRS